MNSESYFKKILVPVDGSHTCLHAEELSAAIAKNFKPKVTVIHVISHELMHPELELRHKVPSSVRSEISSWFSQVGKKIAWEAEALFKEEHAVEIR